MVLYGHTPTPDPEWVNNTICLDTGCVFGGRLTALRYPEKELVSVPAGRVWYEPARPFRAVRGSPRPPSRPARRDPGVLDITDVLGKRVIETGHHGRVTVREENAAAALEVMSRFAVDPRWLLYLPPTMSPSPTSGRPDLLEHPAEAFAAYRARASPTWSARKSTWARGPCCSPAGTRRRPGPVRGAGRHARGGYTRTGRPFFGPGRSRTRAGPYAGGRRAGPGARDRRQLLDAVRAGIGQPASGTSWAPAGCCSTAS